MKKNKRWIIVLLWMVVIFLMSSIPGDPTKSFNEFEFILRKIAHVTEYAILVFLLVWTLNEYHLSKKQKIFLAILIAFMYSVSDEYHQTFISARVGTVYDIIIDSCGILLSALYSKKKMLK